LLRDERGGAVLLERRLRLSGRVVRWDTIVRIEATRRSAPSGIRRSRRRRSRRAIQSSCGARSTRSMNSEG
jgi:hypothetical protein